MDKIICIGKNYLDHAKELGDAVPENPVIFLKPPSVLRTATNDSEISLTIPQNRGSLHYETELVVRLAQGGSNLTLAEAEKAIEAVSVGLEMTLRDLQAQLKKQGHPWTTGKVFPDSVVVGPWLKISEFPQYLEEKFSFSLDGHLKQESTGKQMRFSPSQCIAYISTFFRLEPGDIIYTGTPVGVGPVQANQRGVLKYGSISYSVVWKS